MYCFLKFHETMIRGDIAQGWLAKEIKWATSWQNQQNECVPKEVSDHPGHPRKPRTDLSLLWAHRSFGWVCREVAQMLTNISPYIPIVLWSFSWNIMPQTPVMLLHPDNEYTNPNWTTSLCNRRGLNLQSLVAWSRCSAQWSKLALARH